jgi:CRP-like cAMP-binding protein
VNDRLASSQERLGSVPERHRLIRKLESIADLTAEDKEALLALPMTVKSLAADQDIVRDKDRPTQCCLILVGFVCRYKLLDGGKRQIMSFHTPGDFPDLQSLHLKVMDHSVGTLVPTKLAFIPHASIRDVIRRHPVLNDALWRAAARLTPASRISCARCWCASRPSA